MIDERQQMIIRQSQLTTVIKYTGECGVCLTPVELLQCTELFYSYIVEGYQPEVKERFSKLGDFLKKKQEDNE